MIYKLALYSTLCVNALNVLFLILLLACKRLYQSLFYIKVKGSLEKFSDLPYANVGLGLGVQAYSCNPFCIYKLKVTSQTDQPFHLFFIFFPMN